MSIIGRMVARMTDMLPCNRAIKAVHENIRATTDLRDTVSHFDQTLEQLKPAIDRIAKTMHDGQAHESAR